MKRLFSLYDTFPDRITADGREYRLTLWFDRVLRFISLSDDGEHTPEETVDAGFAWLVDCPKPPPFEVRERVLRRVIDEIIAPPKRRLSSRKKPQRAVDFDFDAAEIYASFMRDYGIDLIKEQGRLHWCAFSALFDGLSENTPIKQIMRIRAEAIPAPTSGNMEYIRRLTELKTLYALPAKNAPQTTQDSGWNGLFDMLLANAEKGGG